MKDVTELVRCPSCGGVKRMHFLCPTCAPSKISENLRKTSMANFLTEYTNMMADLFGALKPKKTETMSKMSEIPLSPSRREIKKAKAAAEAAQNQAKGAEATINKKGGPEA